MKLGSIRLLLGAACGIFALGAVMHGAAFFSKAEAILDASRMPPMFVREMKVLWLADSTTLAALGAICAFMAVKVRSVPAGLMILTVPVPALTAALLYAFLGSFFAAHMLALACLLIATASGLAANAAQRCPRTNSPE